jgi:hypothetical protein
MLNVSQSGPKNLISKLEFQVFIIAWHSRQKLDALIILIDVVWGGGERGGGRWFFAPGVK